MTVALGRMKFWLATMFAASAMLAAVALPAQADASTSSYCGGWKNPWEACNGAQRWLYQTYGWGDQGAVCVLIAGWTGANCSSGAGAGVYSPQLSSDVNGYPRIMNNTGGNNYVHGVALTH